MGPAATDVSARTNLAGKFTPWRPSALGRRAARLTGAAERIIEDSGGQPPPELVNRIEPLPILQQALEPGALERLIGEGRRLAAEDAVSLALSAPDGDEEGDG